MNMYNLFFFFFNDTATTEIYTLSLHDALPISATSRSGERLGRPLPARLQHRRDRRRRSEEHTSELQSQFHLVCRLLLEKKKNSQEQLTNDKPVHQVNIQTPTGDLAHALQHPEH